MAREPWQPGRILSGRYQLELQLGEGGMGSIWRAEHLVLAAPVAVKLVDPEIAEDEETLARFMREAQAAAALRSPHVVQIIDYGMDDKVPFMVMELLEGENLAQRIKRLGRLSPAETARMITHVSRAVGRAHEAGIVHRDLKPENVFIVRNEDDEIAKVLDFGVAKVQAEALAATAKTRTGSLLGTPYYMSPEQAQGNKAVDFRSDLWSIGVIAFECLTGQRPFFSEALGDLVLQICVRDLPVPSKLAPVPAGFDAWFARAIARDPERRFQSARELAEALRDSVGLEGRETLATLSDGEPSAGAPARAAGAERTPSSPRLDDVLHPSQAPTIAVSGNQKPSLTVRQFGTTSVTPPPTRSGTPLVLAVAGSALAAGLIVGFLMLRQRAPSGTEVSDELEYNPPAVQAPAGPVGRELYPPATPSVEPSASAEEAAEEEDTLRRRDADRKDNRTDVAEPSAGTGPAPTTPADAGRRADAGWTKPAWAIPDEEIPRPAPPPPASAPAPPGQPFGQ